MNIRCFMFYIRLLLASPLLGFGVLIRSAPWFLLFGAAVWYLFQNDVLLASSRTLNHLFGTTGAGDGLLSSPAIILSAIFAQYLMLLAFYRCALEAAVQQDLIRRRPFIGNFIPVINLLVAMKFWLFPILVGLLIFLWPYLGEPVDSKILAEPLIDRSDPQKPQIDAPLNMLGAILAFCLLHFPISGVRAVRIAANLLRPDGLFAGFFVLLLLTPAFLTFSWFVILFSMQFLQQVLTGFGQGIVITKGVFSLAVLALTWSCLSVAAAQTLRRVFIKFIRPSKEVPIHVLEKQLGDLIQVGRDHPRQ